MKLRFARVSTHVLQSVTTTVVAGLAGLAVHSVLMAAKDVLGILHEFQPYDDFQRILGTWSGEQGGSLIPYLTGAMFWGFAYARLHAYLPGESFWAKGIGFALLAWGLMATGFFLLVGHGFLGLQLGYGLWPAVFMFPMLATFSLVLSFIHTGMRQGHILRRDKDQLSPHPKNNRLTK
jgi:hypothetical protein